MTSAPLAPSNDTIEWCRNLIRHQSVSMTPNLALIDEVKAFLDGLGYDTLVVRDPSETKANLYATIGP
ncbi:MAG TPA: acetylornithine deacetylase, partial [Thalassospira sp.]|nr:acetylornithine deacetylase [Thalassospira sp.]